MKKYLICIVAASSAVDLLLSLIPDKSGKTKKAVSYIGTLILIMLVIFPLNNITDRISDITHIAKDESDLIEKYDFDCKEFYLSVSDREVTEKITDMLCQKFNITRDMCHVYVELGEDNGYLTVDRVNIILSGSAIFKNPHEIEEFIENSIGCECAVTS